MMFKCRQPVLPDSLHYMQSLILTMLDTVNYLDTEAWVATPGEMSAKWSTLVFNLPPVTSMPLVHGFGCLPCVLCTACLACH